MESSDSNIEFKFKIRDAKEDDIKIIKKIYETIYVSKPKETYFDYFLKMDKVPFLVAELEDKTIIGYLASRINVMNDKVYIASIGVLPEYANSEVEGAMISIIGDSCKSQRVKYIGTHIRGTNTLLRLEFKNKGFYEKLDGKFKNNDDKYLYMKQYVYFGTPASGNFKVTRKEPENFRWGYFQPAKPEKKLPPAVKGVYTITADVKYDDIPSITKLHNKFMGKNRGSDYFHKIYTNKKNPVFVVRDSNKTVIGFLAARLQTKPVYEVKDGKKIMSQKSGGVKNRLNFVSMAVDENWRKLGIAKKLIHMLYDEALKNKRVEAIFGHVRQNNVSAIGLYRKMGFKVRVVGYYEDTKEIKYEIYKRIRLPDIKPFLRKHSSKAAYTAYFVMLHELLHSVRDYK
jgi:ribosomal protein S18 acetylase RimI-like enzyme